MSRATFTRLHRVIFGHFVPARTHRSMDSISKLGMILVYLGSKMNLTQVSLMFGTIPSILSDTIAQMLEVLCKKLKRHPAARIKFPNNNEEMEAYSRLIRQREPTVTNVVLKLISTHIVCIIGAYCRYAFELKKRRQ